MTLDYTVINDEIRIRFFDVSFVSGSSLFMVGDIERIRLASAFESPPESVIVGVTLPIVD